VADEHWRKITVLVEVRERRRGYEKDTRAVLYVRDYYNRALSDHVSHFRSIFVTIMRGHVVIFSLEIFVPAISVSQNCEIQYRIVLQTHMHISEGKYVCHDRVRMKSKLLISYQHKCAYANCKTEKMNNLLNDAR
jgi:hypothetical protein